ncbi:hypothetical protein QJV45_02025 [Listeria booriae]|uniref:HipA family kinase n=1 Tax=Listeria booriae TaxID=1552123 RepID=UPI002880559F|nr:HipA family kinase [Listeria booriae]MDT0109217.1 hypothetical protein [Listeria booriae]
MVKKIYVDAFLKQMGQGVSQPSLIIGDDGNTYILKKGEAQGINLDCLLFNELFCAQIASYLGVPIPEVAIATIEKELIDGDREIIFTHRFKEGDFFASDQLLEVEDNLLENFEVLFRMRKPYIKKSWTAFFDSIVNKSDLAKIIAFDLLIANFDRYDNVGNLLVSSNDDKRMIYAIDHGHAFFGPTWDLGKQRLMMQINDVQEYLNWYISSLLLHKPFMGGQFKLKANGLGRIFQGIEQGVSLEDVNQHDFMEVVYLIESIDENLVDEWFAEIPISWFADADAQKKIYKTFILEQAQLVRHVINRLVESEIFSTYRGGDLQWKEQEQQGHIQL